eukprot:3177525-Amphidinium_carterae.1
MTRTRKRNGRSRTRKNKHPWDRREDDDPTRIPGPSYIPEPVRMEMLTHIRSYYNEGLLTCVDDILSFLDFFDEHGD